MDGGRSDRYEKASKRLAEVGYTIAARNAKRSELDGFLKMLGGMKVLLPEFNESL